MVALALLLLLVAMVARWVAATEAPDAKPTSATFTCPSYPYSDPTEFDSWLRAEGKRVRDQQIQKHEQMMSAIEQGVLKALGGWVAHAGIAQGSEKAKRCSCSSIWAQ